MSPGYQPGLYTDNYFTFIQKIGVVTRFTLILLPHLQDSYCMQAEVPLYQLSPMNNACLIIWNFTLLVSPLVVPSYWVNEYLLAST